MNEEDGGEQGIEREGQRVQREGRGIHRGGQGILSPRVTVFGAGVAGLTAAHELVERGFAVKVVEPTESLDIDGDCEVGGLARSQYSHVSVPEPTSSQGGTSPYPKMRTAWPVIRVPQHIHFSTPVGGQSQIYDPGYVLKPGAPHGGIVLVYSIPYSVKLGEVARALFLGAVAYIKLG